MQEKNFSLISNEELVLKLKELIKQEREILAEILEFLREVETRRLYLSLGYPSLYEFCINHLGYGEAAAYRRIQSMRLLREIPELKTKVSEGLLTITHLSQAQNFFNMESKKNNKVYSKVEKTEILSKLENKSKIEYEKELAKISPNISLLPEESITFISKDKIKLRTTIDYKLYEKLKRLKNLMSHKKANMTYAELISEMTDKVLSNVDPLKKNLNPTGQQISRNNKAADQDEIEKEILTIKMGFPRSRHIPVKIKNFIWQRDGGACTFIDQISNKQCGSQHLLQVDHIQPFSEGGLSTDPRNLRLLCANHNRHRH